MEKELNESDFEIVLSKDLNNYREIHDEELIEFVEIKLNEEEPANIHDEELIEFVEITRDTKILKLSGSSELETNDYIELVQYKFLEGNETIKSFAAKELSKREKLGSDSIKDFVEIKPNKVELKNINDNQNFVAKLKSDNIKQNHENNHLSRKREKMSEKKTKAHERYCKPRELLNERAKLENFLYR